MSEPQTSSNRIAIVATHPIQYYAPWYRHIQRTTGWTVRVFYLWDFGVRAQVDPVFGQPILWDVPLLDGYDYEFVPNISARPGTSHPFGLWNPSLGRRLRAYAPDAVLLQAYNYASIFRLLMTWRASDAPLLFRGDSHRLLPRRGPLADVKRQVVRTIFGRFAGCLYVGAANRRYFEYHGVPAERLYFAPHAVDNARFMAHRELVECDAASWRASLGVPAENRVVMFAGKLEPNKRPVDLLHAFVAAKVPRASLLFVGSGPLEAELRARAAGHSDVYFAPFQNQSVMPRTYAAGDIFVLPSVSETWGLAVNEAQCVGTPVIVSSHVGCAEDLVVHRENGLIFPAGDVAALASALRDALSDDARLRQWGLAGRAHVAAYSYEAATAGLRSAMMSVAPLAASRPVMSAGA